jgi:predicted CoA-substrate-specific enzyme activase
VAQRFIGIDIGTETIKLAELTRDEGRLRWTRRALWEHGKEPAAELLARLREWGWDDVSAAAVSGRLGRQLALPRVPLPQAQARGFRFLRGDVPASVVSIGGHGFSVLELRPGGAEVFRENSRCSQGTGNFLRQLVERFDLEIEAASTLCEDVTDPAPLSGRCPVILKTDMTHLANKGEDRARILAGLYDAVSENVQVLLKPRVCPSRIVLAGGVMRARRIRENFRAFADKHGMELDLLDGDDFAFLEALGSALVAAERGCISPPDDPWKYPTGCGVLGRPPRLEALFAPPAPSELERVPSLAAFMKQVTRLPPTPLPPCDPSRDLLLGFDVGSTGSKVVALDVVTREVVWDAYIRTNGSPVGAAQTLARMFVEADARPGRAVGFAVTGSGREIVGSLLATCYGVDSVFVLNEIAAHARGACEVDARVDTIFEIGGQDAKYIRLVDGRVVDAAMNEACSAGTGSFIEEQGKRFAGIESIGQLGEEAMRAPEGISLGQHCSVFMAEIVDQAIADGVPQESVVAGIYDSIVQNYLNRVKGSRPVGKVVFCQGMPFASDALAAAVARQTGVSVVVPPNPGTVGAHGIALLAHDALAGRERPPLDLARFLAARVEKKETFVCKSVQGCGGAGNRCRIDALTTRVEERKKRFHWGGACSLYDKGTHKKKLPDLSPDPFREREDLVARLLADLPRLAGAPTIALADEFLLKGLAPFFVTFLHGLGLSPLVRTGADHADLKRGIEEANVPFCAPMQLYHGLVSSMAEARPDFLFLPMLRTLPRAAGEEHAVVCPIVQASPDMLRADLGDLGPTRLLTPVVDVGEENLGSAEIRASAFRIAAEIGAPEHLWERAFRAAAAAQERFDADCLTIGARALAFAREHDVVPVVVLGRPYTIYNKVLNSNVPAILREQGAMAIPVDCYPIEDGVPVYEDMYWGHGQRNLRAAHQIRRTPGLYSVYCSNYSCGPDSFNLHFYAYLMEGRPFAVLETDGHSGDAGTKTRIEAFLHCVRSDLAEHREGAPNDLVRIEKNKDDFGHIRRTRERLLVPRMGAGAELMTACIQGLGIPAECLPIPDREALRLGRRHTSGKECVPMTVTLGSLLQRLERARGTDEKFSFFMPTAQGPCRFGVYNTLHKIVLERLGWGDRVGVWTPSCTGYFDDLPPGFAILVFTAFVAGDYLQEALYDVRPVEATPGAAQAIYDRFHARLLDHLRERAGGDLSLSTALLELVSGRLFGCHEIVRKAATELAKVKGDRALPAVLVVGEIYARCDPFTNDFVIDKLEQRGIRARFAPFSEWLEYTDTLNLEAMGAARTFGAQVTSTVQTLITNVLYGAAARLLGWPARTTVADSLRAAHGYIRPELQGEAVLTLGGPVHEWRQGHIDGVVSVGPLECMPNKISEAQFFHVTEREGLPSLTISLNGDPIDPEVLDTFAFDIHTRWAAKRSGASTHAPARRRQASVRLPAADGGLVQLRRSRTAARVD